MSRRAPLCASIALIALPGAAPAQQQPAQQQLLRQRRQISPALLQQVQQMQRARCEPGTIVQALRRGFMPDVVGCQGAPVTRAAIQAGYVLTTAETPSSRPAGEITYQAPSPGTRAPALEGHFSITVSTGQASTPAPNPTPSYAPTPTPTPGPTPAPTPTLSPSPSPTLAPYPIAPQPTPSPLPSATPSPSPTPDGGDGGDNRVDQTPLIVILTLGGILGSGLLGWTAFRIWGPQRPAPVPPPPPLAAACVIDPGLVEPGEAGPAGDAKFEVPPVTIDVTIETDPPRAEEGETDDG